MYSRFPKSLLTLPKLKELTFGTDIDDPLIELIHGITRPLPVLNGFVAIGNDLANCQNLNHVTVSGCHISVENIEPLFEEMWECFLIIKDRLVDVPK